ncbi:carbohydrate esterase family 16 protein [Ceratobasidium sp. AG-Ba]|nr:carbohydrate esterase family 16 protein [Ceratobasidium sp. AG-Ba]
MARPDIRRTVQTKLGVGYMTRGLNTSSLIAFDYAISGNNVTGYTNQIQRGFMPAAGRKPASSPWTADNSLFISWIGINDIHAGYDATTTINAITRQQQSLYDVGARNFVLINMPPWDRSPMGTYGSQPSISH